MTRVYKVQWFDKSSEQVAEKICGAYCVLLGKIKKSTCTEKTLLPPHPLSPLGGHNKNIFPFFIKEFL